MQSAGGPQFNGRGVMVQVMQSSGTPLQRPRVAQPVSIIWKFVLFKHTVHVLVCVRGRGGEPAHKFRIISTCDLFAVTISVTTALIQSKDYQSSQQE